MSEPKEVVQNNWYRAVVALRYAKDGLQQFIVEEIDRFHKRVYKQIPTGKTCNNCALENIVPCPTHGICGPPDKCRFHDRNYPAKQPRPCQLNICSQVWKDLKDKHRYGKPSCSNTTSQDWHCNAWELGKAFISTPGYKDKKTADDTDLAGLLSIISTFKDFRKLISEDLSEATNVFYQSRQLRNEIMHNALLEIPTVKLTEVCRVLTKMLSDPNKILNRPEAILAVQNIDELQAPNTDKSPKEQIKFLEKVNDAIITLNAEESKVLEHINAEIEKAKKKLKQEIDDQLHGAIQTFTLDAHSAGQQVTNQIQMEGQNAIDSIDRKTQASMEKIEAAKQTRLDQEASDNPGNPEQAKKVKTLKSKSVVKHQTINIERNYNIHVQIGGNVLVNSDNQTNVSSPGSLTFEGNQVNQVMQNLKQKNN